MSYTFDLSKRQFANDRGAISTDIVRRPTGIHMNLEGRDVLNLLWPILVHILVQVITEINNRYLAWLPTHVR